MFIRQGRYFSDAEMEQARGVHLCENSHVHHHCVSHEQEERAREHGVILLHTVAPREVVAVSLADGNPVRRGNLLWVQDQLTQWGIPVKGTENG